VTEHITGSPDRRPSTQCKVAHKCAYCRRWIKEGTWTALDYDGRNWIHWACHKKELRFKLRFNGGSLPDSGTKAAT
jgi:hypothetical protein